MGMHQTLALAAKMSPSLDSKQYSGLALLPFHFYQVGLLPFTQKENANISSMFFKSY
jgi:hypothetical protein